MSANATVAASSWDRINGNVNISNAGFASGAGKAIGPSYQSYNSMRLQQLGGPIVQGQINKIRISEIVFPYDISTVVAGRNDTITAVYITQVLPGTVPAAAYPYQVVLPAGFYTGPEMAAALETELLAGAAAAGWAGGSIGVAHNGGTGVVSITNLTAFAPAGANFILALTTSGAVSNNTILSQPQLLYTIGLRQLYAQCPTTVDLVTSSVLTFNALTPAGLSPATLPYLNFPGSATTFSGSPYTGKYTEWIDITSPVLCQAAYIRDGSTTQTINRRDIVCRLYIADEISVYNADPVGVRPFIIHRQFKNPRIIKWTADRSIDAVDFNLYDMYGLPLPTTMPSSVAAALGSTEFVCGPRDFAITIYVDEHDTTTEGNVGYAY